MHILETLNASKQRTISGLAMLAVVLTVGILDNFFVVWAFLGVIYLFAFYEANKLFGIDNNTLYFFAILLWVSAAFYPYGDDLFFIAALLFGSYLAYTQNVEFKLFLPFIYPSAGFLFMLALYNEYSMLSLLWLLVVVALTDTGAYFVGKSIGKTRFCETSPNKTLEGVVGGVLIASVIGLFIGVSIVDIEKALLISAFVSLSSIFGDLFESYLKRKADVKDSGNLIPGHGGILDRVDGYLFASVAMLVLLRGIA